MCFVFNEGHSICRLISKEDDSHDFEVFYPLFLLKALNCCLGDQGRIRVRKDVENQQPVRTMRTVEICEQVRTLTNQRPVRAVRAVEISTSVRSGACCAYCCDFRTGAYADQSAILYDSVADMDAIVSMPDAGFVGERCGPAAAWFLKRCYPTAASWLLRYCPVSVGLLLWCRLEPSPSNAVTD